MPRMSPFVVDPTVIPSGPDGGPLWPRSVEAARALQLALRPRLSMAPPPGFAPRIVAGADVSAAKFSRRGFAAIVCIDAETMETVDEGTADEELSMPYIPGYLAFRELPILATAWSRLRVRPDVLVFDAQGYAHPRRFGLACLGGMALGVPAVGCAKTILVGTHGPLGHARGSTAPLVDGGETVGAAVRTQDGRNPLYVSAGHGMDLPSSVALVLRMAHRWRQPETTRRSHHLVNELRRAAGE